MNEPPALPPSRKTIDPSLYIGGLVKKLGEINRMGLGPAVRRYPVTSIALCAAIWLTIFAVWIGGSVLLADWQTGQLHWPARAAAAPVTLAEGIRVIDGDTIQVRASGERIRIENIDAPEIGDHAHCAAEAVLAIKARYYLEQRMAKASDLTLIPDARRPRDVYGRTLGRIELDGRDVGDDLMAAGLAQPWRGHHAHWC